MKQIMYTYFGVIVLIASVLTLEAQKLTPTPLPTLSRNSPLRDTFPVNMYCHDLGKPSKGSTWGEIAIGISSVDDLKAYLATVSHYDSIAQWADYISFSRTGNLRDENAPPSLIEACIDVSTQIVTALRVSNNHVLHLQDLLAEYGVPDKVTWGNSNISRTVFWFEEGIAASVYILEQNKNLDYGEVGLIVYFPYQPDKGFEKRWPFIHTNVENPVGGDRVYDPPPSEEQNPFDFEIIMATITAQPSRTPTPTFEPPVSTLTATPAQQLND